MTSCPACGQNIPAGARFCGACGHQTSEDSGHPGLVGTTIANRYRVLRVVAEGGMGIVYEAEQSMGEGVRKVAIKTLLPELSRDPIVVSRFNRECSVVAGLEHPNTVRVYDFGTTDDGTLYIAMEFVRGRPLGDVIAEGPMPLQRCMGIMEQVTSALEEAHNQGIVHRDLKPDNLVLCDRAGLRDFVKVLDFGIAKRSSAGGRHDTKLTQQGMVLGTPPYMSPEQFTGEGLDRTSDVYSLAIIFYEMVNSRLPFEGDTPWQWAHQHMSVAPAPFVVTVPDEVQQVVLAALSKASSGRPGTAVELYRRLLAACGTNLGSRSRVIEPVPAAPAQLASMVKGDTNPEEPALGMRTEPSMLREPPAPNTLDDASTGTEPGGSKTGMVAAAASSTGTVPGAPRIAPSVALANRGEDLSGWRPTPRRTGRNLVLVLAIVSAMLGASGAVVWWVRSQRANVDEPPTPSAAVAPSETTEIAAEWPLLPVSTGRVIGPTTASPPNHAAGTQGSTRPVPAASGAQTVPSNPSQPLPVPTATPASPFPFPFPIALPSIFTAPGLPPVVVPAPAPPTPAPPAPAPAPSPPTAPTAGMQNCTQAIALAATDLDAAIGQYQICEGAIGQAAAAKTRSQIATIGVARARALAAQGRCDEANQIVQTLSRIGAQRAALNAIRQAGCRV